MQAIPLGIMGGKALAGFISNRNATKKLKAAEQERQGIIRGTKDLAGLFKGSGESLSNQGMSGITPAMNYYRTLLGGNRAAMAEATAAPRAALTDTYRGAERALEYSNVQGAARDTATADLIRDRTAKISGLTTGVQPAAASALGDLSGNVLAQGTQRLGAAGNLWRGMMGDASENRNTMQGRADVTGSQFGSSLFDLISGGGKIAEDWMQRRHAGGVKPPASAPWFSY